MRKTIAQQIINEMENDGYKLVGRTRGWRSFRKNSNLSKKLVELGLKREDVFVETAARAGIYANDGYQLLIFLRHGMTGTK